MTPQRKKASGAPRPKSAETHPCTKCTRPTQAYHDLRKVYACADCQKQDKTLVMVTRTEAQDLLASDRDLNRLRNVEIKGVTHYLKQDIEEEMIDKYGTAQEYKNALGKSRTKTGEAKTSDREKSTKKEKKEKRLTEVKYASYRAGKYACFHSMSMNPFDLDDHTWSSAEHYFQAQKFVGQPLFDAIRKAPDSLKARKLGEMDTPFRTDWDDIKGEVMYKAVYAKFSQNPDIQELLLSTGIVPIIERSTDDYWADGGDGYGQNQMGKILGIVRSKIQRENDANARKRKRGSSPARDDPREKGKERAVDRGRSATSAAGGDIKGKRRRTDQPPPQPPKPTVETWDITTRM
eukprot:TRINITY_DN9681_c0_g1_i3.p1 TRINITY_DN9681_c0_g1~~TRINITY_DN9681_c0_g1_i3.p1  ORF type:complete len:349 (+),score=54.87 TRINITY_DN9681_c0_g1_i3:210-1256(+)